MAWPIVFLLLLHQVTAASIANGNTEAKHSDPNEEKIFSLDGTHTAKQISFTPKEPKQEHVSNQATTISQHSKIDPQKKEKVSLQNQENIQFTITEPSLCDGQVFLLIVVCSSVTNFDSRQAIRETWGKSPGPKTKVAFLLGTPDESHGDLKMLMEKVTEEKDMYHDVIQENMVDSYKTLADKSVAMLKWINIYCTNARYVLKTDDDQYINVPLLLQDLYNSVHTRFIMGDIIAGAQPITDKNSKYYTPKSLFPDTMFPKYMSGSAYVISGDIIDDLYNATLHTKLFWLEDIHITGLCAQKVGVTHVYNGKFGYRKRVLDPCLFRIVITAHRLLPDELRKVWNRLSDPSLTCRHTRINLGNAE